jgi:peptidoglycan/LPS O-acetylase OafA/YrhL
MFALAAPIALTLAALSWHLLEKPMLSFKRARGPVVEGEGVAP